MESESEDLLIVAPSGGFFDGLSQTPKLTLK
jgi:hypothetical protein